MTSQNTTIPSEDTMTIDPTAGAARETPMVDISTITPGTTVEGTTAGRAADGSPITRTLRVTVDRTPWMSGDGRNVILATATGVDAVIAETLRIVTADSPAADTEVPVEVREQEQTTPTSAADLFHTAEMHKACALAAQHDGDQAKVDEHLRFAQVNAELAIARTLGALLIQTNHTPTEDNTTAWSAFTDTTAWAELLAPPSPR